MKNKKNKAKQIHPVGIVLRVLLYILISLAVVAVVTGAFYFLMRQDNDAVKKLVDSGYLICVFVAIVVFANVIVVLSLFLIGKGGSGGKAADGNSVSRFGSLSDIDAQMVSYTEPAHNESITLSEFCEGFRNYAANKLGLYYDMMTIRAFVSSLPVSKLMIMQGISGTGKTSLAWAFGEYIGNPSSIIPVQPSWKEKTDLLGYFNEFTNSYNETEFLRSIYKAHNTDGVNVIVLDEMNIARVEYYFAEFLSLLEIKQADSRYIDLTSNGWASDPKYIENGRIRIPENIWYIGTANNDDSTMAISDKVYDRAMVIDLDKRANPFTAPDTETVSISYSYLMKLGNEAMNTNKLSDEVKKKIAELDSFLIENLEVSFGNRIMRQLEEFVPIYMSTGGTELEAVDIIVSRKVLRKLEAKNPLLVKRSAPGFVAVLDSVFGEDELKLCREVFNKFSI